MADVGPSPSERPTMPARAQVRVLVAQHIRELQAVAARGGNPHQTALDQNDQMEAFAHTLGPDQGALFLRLYAEESEAASHKLAHDAERTAERARRREQERGEEEAKQQQMAAQIGGGIVTVILFALIFGVCR